MGSLGGDSLKTLSLGEANPLLELLRACTVRIDRGGEFLGTGFFVTTTQVLTCAHVLHGEAPVMVRSSHQKCLASVSSRVPSIGPSDAAAAFYPMPDLALLEVRDSVPEQPCARLASAMPAAGIEPDQLWLTGFCRDGHETDVVGQAGASLEFEGSFFENGWELLKLKRGQVISGFSGSPLLNLRSGAVCGVLDSTRGQHAALGGFAVPVATVAATFPGLLEANEGHHREDSRWRRAVEEEGVARQRRRGEEEGLPLLTPLKDLKRQADLAPSDLLRPRHGLVPMVGREELQAQLMRWREGEQRLGVVVVTGGGGFGKTRLAIEECESARRAGWTAGLLSATAGLTAGEVVERLAAWEGRVLIAVDYAETRPDLVGPLIERLARRRKGPPVRLLLVCRQAQTRQQWEELFAAGDGRDEVLEVLRSAEPVRLEEEELDRPLLFETAFTAISEWLEVPRGAIRRPSLRAPHFDRPLFVIAAALLAVRDPDLDVDSMGGDDLFLELIDRHEKRYWERWDRSLRLDLDPALRARAVAAAALLGADGEEESLALAGAVPGLGDASEERRREIARWLGELYGKGEGSLSINSIEPDMLAEALVARECGLKPDLLDSVLDAATPVQLTRALNLMARGGAGNPGFALLARDALDRHLPSLVERASGFHGDPELVRALELAVVAVRPEAGAVDAWRRLTGLVPATLALQVCQVAVEALSRVAGVPGTAEEIARALGDQAISLNRLGRHREALQPAEDAAAMLKHLIAEEGEEIVRPHLAHTLGTLAEALNNCGRFEEAIEVAEEAAVLWRDPYEREPERCEPGFASALERLSQVLANRGRREEALEAAAEAVTIRRRRHGEDPDERVGLAYCLQMYSERLGVLRCFDEALVAGGEAVELARESVESNPTAGPLLAEALLAHSKALEVQRRHEEALRASEEAVSLFRVMQQGSGKFMPQLATALHRMAAALANREEHLAAAEAAAEAVFYRRHLLGAEGRHYLLPLATSLELAAAELFQLGRAHSALEPSGESERYWRELAEEDDRFLPDLARALNTRFDVLVHAGRPEPALAAISEAVGCYRQLLRTDSATFRYEYSGCLRNLAVALGRAGNLEGARSAAEEAVRHLRTLREVDPAFGEDLGEALDSLATGHGMLGETEAALACSREAVELFRELGAEVGPKSRAALARSLGNLSRGLSGEEAVAVAAESADIFRELSDADPQQWESRLIDAAWTLADALEKVGREAEGDALARRTLADARTRRGRFLAAMVLVRRHLAGEELDEALPLAWSTYREAQEAEDIYGYEIRGFLRQLRLKLREEFDGCWDRCLDDPQPVWLRIASSDPETLRLVDEWCHIGALEPARRYLEDHGEEMLSDRGEAAIEHLIELQPGEKRLASCRAILVDVRRDGIDVVFEQLTEVEGTMRLATLVQTWVGLPAEEAQSFLLEHEEELLSPTVESLFLRTALDESEGIAPSPTSASSRCVVARGSPQHTHRSTRSRSPANENAPRRTVDRESLRWPGSWPEGWRAIPRSTCDMRWRRRPREHKRRPRMRSVAAGLPSLPGRSPTTCAASSAWRPSWTARVPTSARWRHC